MTTTEKRIQLTSALPDARRKLGELHMVVSNEAVEAGLDPLLMELIKIRASQINGCAFCLDMHSRDARKLGESERRIVMLSAWRETELYTPLERAVLDLTEAMTRLPELQDVPDEVYDAAAELLDTRQLTAVAWAITLINTFNRFGVTSRPPLPADPA